MIRIALDPGHGGKDPGATYKGITEAKLVFNERQEDGVTVADGLTNRLAHYLRERGHSVLFTRSADENPPKRVRAERAISWGAQMYISVHVNAGGGSGSEVWINPDCRFVEGSKAIANVALEVAQRLGVRSRGIKLTTDNARARNVIGRLRNRMPAVLIEVAFIDNDLELLLLTNKIWRDAWAYNLAKRLARIK